MERGFYVDTPLGALHVYAKHSIVDDPGDFPGVYIDLILPGHDREMIACVEYDSGDGTMLTTAYDIGCDEPVVVHHYDLGDDSDTEYVASIVESVSGQFVVGMDGDRARLGARDHRMMFCDKENAEDFLEQLRSKNEGCFILMREDGWRDE